MTDWHALCRFGETPSCYIQGCAERNSSSSSTPESAQLRSATSPRMTPPKARHTAAIAGSASVDKNPRRTAKSRTGCQTCKVKRLKCDETRPACENCLKRGHDCPGYKKALKWSTKYEVLQSDGSESQKVFHPSVDYHFSSIDPSSFGDAGPSSGNVGYTGGKAPDSDRKPRDLEQIIDTTVAQHVHPAQVVPGLRPHGPICAWTDHLPFYPAHTQQGLVPYDCSGLSARSNSDGEYDNGDGDDYAQVIPRERSNSPEEIKQWKSLLRSYCLMSTPELPKTLQNDSTRLVEHYFRDTCALYAAFDSKLNPFRTVVGRLWDNSSPIFYAIQSMAAAHLTNYMPHMKVTGLQMQRKAYESLQRELKHANNDQKVHDNILLTVFLLGMSSPWHEAGDLGMAHLVAARSLVKPRLARNDGTQPAEFVHNDQFFAEALIYWDMCMSFVIPEPLKRGQGKPQKCPNFDQGRMVEGKLLPHPWTGIAPRSQMIFAEVGRLVRTYCAIRLPLSYGMTDDEVVASASEILNAAAEYEDELMSIHMPDPDDLVDVQDDYTSAKDLVNIGEATRCAALLEIYRVFPEILRSRLNGASKHPPSGCSIAASAPSVPFSGLPRKPKDNSHVEWLTSLARHITMDLIGALPQTSGTRPLQLILVATAAAELRLASPGVSSPGVTASTDHDLDIARARGFAMARLHQLGLRLPAKPVVAIIDCLRETWRRYDNDEEVFWLDVMHQNGWQTVMG